MKVGQVPLVMSVGPRWTLGTTSEQSLMASEGWL